MSTSLLLNYRLQATQCCGKSGYLALCAALTCLLLVPPTIYAQDWPRVPLPKDLQTFDIGQQVNVNSLPMRLEGFVSALKPDQLIDLFRQSLGKPIVENTLGAKRILGRLQGEYYVSVQIEPAGTGSRGVTAVTHLKASYDSQEQTKTDRELWLARLPSGSRLLSQMNSQDAGKSSKHLVFTNAQSENLNRDQLKNILLEDGMVFEREGSPSRDAPTKLSEGLHNSKMLFFKGPGKEALATIYRDNDGQTTVVLNVVTQIERFK